MGIELRSTDSAASIFSMLSHLRGLSLLQTSLKTLSPGAFLGTLEMVLSHTHAWNLVSRGLSWSFHPLLVLRDSWRLSSHPGAISTSGQGPRC